MRRESVVHVIDDEDSVRRSLAMLLEAEGFRVETYEAAQSAMADPRKLASGCIVTDVRMSGMSGLEFVEALHAQGIQSPIIVITGHADVSMAVSAMKAGAIDFLEKPFEPEVFLNVVAGAVSAVAVDEVMEETLRRFNTLSNRERQVLFKLVEGATNKTIASTLDLSPRTVEIYRAKVMLKMRASSLSELVRMALKGRLV